MLRKIPRTISSLTAALSLILLMASPSSAATMSTAPQSVHTDTDPEADAPNILEDTHVEGHIAFLHAELRITDAEEPLWTPVAEAMRQDVNTMQSFESKVASTKSGESSAPAYLEDRVQFANLRAQGEARFLAAFRPLYEALSPHQKRMADKLLIQTAPDQ